MPTISAILDFLGITAWIERFIQRKADERVGEIKQENADLLAQNASLKRQAQAMVDTPRTPEELEAKLDRGEI